ATASLKSLAAIEAASLAASMHANRAYWASGIAAPGQVLILGSSISDASLAAAVPCSAAIATSASCTPLQIAAWDVQHGAAAISAGLPNPVSTVGCTPRVARPIGCVIEITWTDSPDSSDRKAQAPAGRPSYTLSVEP